ncbi:MAG: hypothetical protein HZA93_02345 [Verrucomicrobia bacterium]|nr:hypothetical protein [Verrucomicrobiota bacterium]
MLALAFSFSIFVFWTLVGRATLALVQPRWGVLRPWLLAPGLGLALTLLATTIVNQAGVPLSRGTWPITLGLGLAAAAVFVRTRPAFPVRQGRWFLAAAVASLLWTGWPAFQSGFNWISYGNDDMANYCLAAERFNSHGFYAVPTMAELSGRDYASYYFFMHVADMMRFGAEHIVSWTASLLRIKATQAFMPAILALALTQLFAAAALALQHGRHRRLALAAAWLLAASPLFMLGTLYQLIAQVAGIALQLTTLALLTRGWGRARRREVIRFSVLTAIAGAGLCLVYPETTPFTVVAFLAYHGIAILRGKHSPKVTIALTAYTLLGVIVLMRHNVISYLFILVMQLTSAMHSANLLLSLFPYFLLPTGFSNFYGWMPIAKDFAEPVVSLSIAAGILLSGVVLWRAVRESWRVSAAAILFLVDVAVALKLYLSASDFTLYKLAMWTQPVLAIALAGLVLRYRSAPILIALFALSTAPSALHYSGAAQGYSSGGMTELRYGSRYGLAVSPLPADPEAQITASIENVVAAKFAGSELRGRQLAFASRDYFFPNTRVDFRNPPQPVTFQPHYADMAQARPLMLERNAHWQKTSMLWLTEFSQPVLTRPTDFYLRLSDQLSLFNKLGRDPAAPEQKTFVLEPASAIRNHLIFVHSGLGNHYYLGDRSRIAFFQQEADRFSGGGDFNGLGRFLLLRVEHPTEKLYLRVAATRTQVTGRTGWKPNKVTDGHLFGPVVHGETDLPMHLVGHGAFNLFFGPVTPRKFEDAYYVALDFADVTRVIMDYRPGLKTLFNAEVPLDYRRLIGWARDVSAISDTEYAALPRPRAIEKFPADLARATTLEFIGAYEDGWLSGDSRFLLASAQPGEFVRLRGAVPDIPGARLGDGTLRVSLNGTPVADLPALLGQFDWLLPLAHSAGPTKIELHFTATAALPGRDGRPVGAKLDQLSLAAPSPHGTWDYTQTNAPRLAAPGVDSDGWMARAASILLPPSATARDLALKIEFPGWASQQPTELRVRLGESPPASHTLSPNQYAIVRVRVPPSTSPVTLHLDAAGEFSLPSPDLRRRSCRLLEVVLTPAPDA